MSAEWTVIGRGSDGRLVKIRGEAADVAEGWGQIQECVARRLMGVGNLRALALRRKPKVKRTPEES